jgi:hypothetical protein
MKEELLKATYIVVITLIVGFILACCVGIMIDHINPPQPQTTTIYQTVAPAPQPTTTMTSIDYSYIPSIITYTVRSTDLTNLEVVTTSGNILYFESRGAWGEQVKRCTYTAEVERSNGYSYVIKGYPELEVAYIAPNNDHNHGKYIEV